MEYRPSITPKVIVALCVAAVPIGLLGLLYYALNHSTDL